MGKTRGLLKKYCEYDETLAMLSFEYGLERRIFINSCTSLLTPITGSEIADEMIRKAEHWGWTNSDWSSAMRRRLGSNTTVLQSLLELLKDKLVSFEALLSRESIEKSSNGVSLENQKLVAFLITSRTSRNLVPSLAHVTA